MTQALDDGRKNKTDTINGICLFVPYHCRPALPCHKPSCHGLLPFISAFWDPDHERPSNLAAEAATETSEVIVLSRLCPFPGLSQDAPGMV